MDKADLDCVAIEEHVNAPSKQDCYMYLHSMDTVDSDCVAIEEHLNHST
jgi:hypothetical protein